VSGVLWSSEGCLRAGSHHEYELWTYVGPNGTPCSSGSGFFIRLFEEVEVVKANRTGGTAGTDLALARGARTDRANRGGDKKGRKGKWPNPRAGRH